MTRRMQPNRDEKVEAIKDFLIVGSADPVVASCLRCVARVDVDFKNGALCRENFEEKVNELVVFMRKQFPAIHRSIEHMDADEMITEAVLSVASEMPKAPWQ